MRDSLQQVRHLALNLDRYRNVSAEWMTRPHAGSDAHTISATFYCECAREGCHETVTLTLAEYEAVRCNPEQFFVAPSTDHVYTDVERIVEANPRYFVVERITTAVGRSQRSS